MAIKKLTKAAVDGLKPRGQAYSESIIEHPGLRVRVMPSGHKTVEVFKRPKGQTKPVRVKVCAWGELSIAGIKDRYHEISTMLARGDNPNETIRKTGLEAELNDLTVKQAFDSMMANKTRAANTVKGYNNAMDRHLTSWANKKIKTIQESDIQALHAEIAEDFPSAANDAVRVFRAIWYHVYKTYKANNKRLFDPWPVDDMGKWFHRESPRKGHIEPHQIASWWEAVDTLSPKMSAYLKFVILTGLRRREASTLTWDHVDLKAKSFTITADQAKNSNEAELPLSDYLVELLQERYKATKGRGGPFLLQEPKKSVTKVRELSGIYFTVHDLRRSFATYCDEVQLGRYTIKALMNHAFNDKSSDITEDYIQFSVERLRPAMQKVTDFVTGHAGIREDNVVELPVENQA